MRFIENWIARTCWRVCRRFPHTPLPMWILVRAGRWQRHAIWGEP